MASTAQEHPSKKPYESPALTTYGSVERLTQTLLPRSSNSDGGTYPNSFTGAQ
jgi:hypothetical protein